MKFIADNPYVNKSLLLSLPEASNILIEGLVANICAIDREFVIHEILLNCFINDLDIYTFVVL